MSRTYISTSRATSCSYLGSSSPTPPPPGSPPRRIDPLSCLVNCHHVTDPWATGTRLCTARWTRPYTGVGVYCQGGVHSKYYIVQHWSTAQPGVQCLPPCLLSLGFNRPIALPLHHHPLIQSVCVRKVFICNKQVLRQGGSWCDDLDSKVLTKFCRPNSYSKCQ